MIDRTYTQHEVDTLLDKTVSKRVKEANADAWAKGINGALQLHTDAIEKLGNEIQLLLHEYHRREDEKIEHRSHEHWWQETLIRVGIYLTIASQIILSATAVAGVLEHHK